MSLPIHVDAYPGHKANERPRYFTVDEDLYEISDVLDQWFEPSAIYFKVKSTEGKTYLLRYDEGTDEWTLQSGLDGDELLTRPSIEIITVEADVIRWAEKEIESREHYRPDDVEIPFDWILAEVTAKRICLEQTGTISKLQTSDTEKTLAEPKDHFLSHRPENVRSKTNCSAQCFGICLRFSFFIFQPN